MISVSYRSYILTYMQIKYSGNGWLVGISVSYRSYILTYVNPNMIMIINPEVEFPSPIGVIFSLI